MGKARLGSRRHAAGAGLAGLLVVAGYAAVGAVQILVWNPLAAVPGATLAQIRAHLDGSNETLAAPLVLAWAGTGVVLAAAVLLAALVSPGVRLRDVVVLDLLVLALAAPSHWVASFPAGMGIADAFGTTGGDHAPWGMVLYALSTLALLALVLALAVGGIVSTEGGQADGSCRRQVRRRLP
jgi:hypothetical protein